MPRERLLRLPSREGGWLQADLRVASTNPCLEAATHLKPSHHLASTEALPPSLAPHLEGAHLGLHARAGTHNPLRLLQTPEDRTSRSGCQELGSLCS